MSGQVVASTLVFANAQWLWVCLGFGLLALIALYLSYRKSHLTGPWKAAAIFLKLAAFALLVISLLEPVRVETFPRNGSNDLIILADNSEGLAIGDEGERMRKALQTPDEDFAPWMEELDDLFRLQLYQFDRRLNRVDDFSGLDFGGNASSVLTSLSGLRDRFRNRPLAAMVVITDGNATDLAAMDSAMKTLSSGETDAAEVPVFPVIVGRPPDRPDLALQSVSVAQTAFEDAPVLVRIEAEAAGEFPGGTEVYALDEQGLEVKSEPIVFAGDGDVRRGNARIEIAGVPPGISFYTIGIRPVVRGEDDPPPREVTEKNNQRIVAVDRGRGPYPVLYVSGRPNWEYKFLRRAISEDAEVQLIGLIRIARREPKFEWRGRVGESGNPLFRGFGKDLPEETQSYDEPVLIRLNTRNREELRDGFPRDAETLFSEYRAVILDDVEADLLSAEQQNLLERFVAKRGGTVIMLGGRESFRGGDWENTPVARLLPVHLDRLDRGGPARFATFNLSREGWLEPWMRLRDNEEAETNRLAYMPQFFAVNRVSAIKPGASLLATVTDGERRLHPAVVIQRFGEGRSGAVTVGDFWRWGMKDAELQGDLAKMWRQLVRWAVSDVPDRLSLDLEQVSDGTLPLTRFRARVRTREFLPQDDATVRFSLRVPGSTEPAPISGEPSLEEAGVFTADHFLEAAGGYRLETTARDGEGALIGERESGWAFNPEAEEFRSLQPNRELLEKLAEASGGSVLELDELPSLPARLAGLNVPVTDTRQRPFWHAPWAFCAALLCLVGEWGIRRWKGAL